jgi:glycine/D-amino acid oxidase-like deaminating enzyme
VDRVPLFWFEPKSHHEELARLPVYIIDGEVTRGCYGFPYLADQGLKVATLGTGIGCDPDLVDRKTSLEDEAPARQFLQDHLSCGNGALRASKVCMYTMSPDEHFIIGIDQRIVYASACSGHGFKFSSVIGEILADLATKGGTPHDINFISRNRFAQRIRDRLPRLLRSRRGGRAPRGRSRRQRCWLDSDRPGRTRHAAPPE